KIKETVKMIVEISFRVERLMLAILENSYQKEEIIVRGKKKEREVLKLPPILTPYFVAVIPSPIGKKEEKNQKKKEEIKQKAKQLYLELLKFSNFSVSYEATDSIGKNYYRQDTIGTYYCLTVDYSTVVLQSPDYNTITIRYRDT